MYKSNVRLYVVTQSEGLVEDIVETLLKMLEKDAIDHSKTCAEYFEFFKSYAGSVSGS